MKKLTTGYASANVIHTARRDGATSGGLSITGTVEAYHNATASEPAVSTTFSTAHSACQCAALGRSSTSISPVTTNSTPSATCAPDSAMTNSSASRLPG